MGGAYNGHPPLRPFQVHATANSHPITQGMSPFMVNDEQHYVIYDKDPKYVILEAENLDGLNFEDRGTKSFPAGPTTSARAGWCLLRLAIRSMPCGILST